jgi:hypothetical protein
MVGAVTRGNEGWRRAGAAALLLTVVAGCGSGSNKLFVLPAGTAFEGTRSDRVLVVVESQNACADIGTCEPTAPSPCHLGDGNTRGLAVYRLGPEGLLFDADGDGMAVPEQVIATDDNPRRVLAHPNDPTLLYVATNERIQVFRLASDGVTRCIGETLSEIEVVPGADDLDPIDMVIDPTIGNGVLYVAAKGANRIDAYAIGADGTLPQIPSSCVVGPTIAEFSAVALLSDTFIATGGRDRIDVYNRVSGQFPDVQSGTTTPTPVPTPGGGGTAIEPGETPSPSAVLPTPTIAPTCIGALVITAPVSSLSAGLVTDIEFLPLDTEPLGDLVVAEEVTQRLFTFPIDTQGVLSDNFTSETDRASFYQRLLRVDRPGGSFIYAGVFQEGQVEVFRRQDDGRLPNVNFSKSRSDPFTLPVGLAVDGPTGPVLYVAQEGVGRVDGFRIRTDGGIDSVPLSSTAPVRRDDGGTINTFPDDVVILPLP